MSNPLRNVLNRLSRPSSEREKEDLQIQCRATGAMPIDTIEDRQLCRCTGLVRSVSMRPREGDVPALVAELDDGHRMMTLVWLGRRAIPGISPGVTLTVKGRVAIRKGTPIVFNPSYEILPPAGP